MERKQSGVSGIDQESGKKRRLGMSVDEAAMEAGVSSATIYGLFHTGKLPFARRLNSRIVIHRESFEKWLAGELEEAN